MIPKNPDHRLSKGPLIFAALAIVFMAVWSIVHWSQMAPSIVTRQAAGNHGASRVSREVTAVAAPAALPARRSRACRVTRMDDDAALRSPAIPTSVKAPMSRSTVSRNRLMIKRVSPPASTGSALRHLRLRLVRYSLCTYFTNTSPARVSSVAATDTR